MAKDEKKRKPPKHPLITDPIKKIPEIKEMRQVILTLMSGHRLSMGLEPGTIKLLRENINDAKHAFVRKEMQQTPLVDIMSYQPDFLREKNESFWVDLVRVESLKVEIPVEKSQIDTLEKPKIIH